jgi:hypothetical protein
MRYLFFIFSCVCLGLAQTRPSHDISAAPVPPDPHELVTGTAAFASSPQERSGAMAILERARQNSDMHMPGGSPFVLKVAIAVMTGSQAGNGQVAETWFSGHEWRYDQSLGTYSETRVSAGGQIFEKHANFTPMGVQMVRSSLFWPVIGNPAVSTIRTAQASWNGRPVTAILISGSTDATPPGRHWAETEYVVDNATGLLQIYSRAPGTFAIYSYSQGLQFHGRTVPDQITVFTAGLKTVDARILSIADPSAQDRAALQVEPGMQPTGTAAMNQRFPLYAPDPTNSGVIKPVMIHVTLDDRGAVVESEVSAAADPALIDRALALVKSSKFGGARMDAYIAVRFGQ